MKFRGKIIDVACLNHFTRVITTISKLTKTCVLRLTPDNLFFILSEKVANGGVSMWCELAQANFFDEFQMEGVSEDDNEICLEVAPENLARALKTVQNAKALKVKLTKKHCPCLTFAADLPTLSRASYARLRRQYLPPSAQTLKNVVDRMKNLSNFLVLEANMNGEMNLKIDTDLVSVTTHFKDLGNPPWGDDGSQKDCEVLAQVRLDVRRLQQFLTGQQVNPTKALCNLVHHRLVHLILLHEDVSLQYFIPAVA
ncbi:hypothetical protein WMY93_029163 [Mugilogobius chulae]|uniref:Checkpoint protein n=1 Tax=Mugilogobius chulae TaxID=88201 RepID=A0AAW0MUL9_9GOBI